MSHRPRSHYTTCQGFNLHYTEWGDPDAPLVIAWHGLARTGRDFDVLAEHLADRYHVVCPDTIGRGFSQWSQHPDEDYCLGRYAALALDLLDHLGDAQAHWIGTSMGGAIGLVCAAAQAVPAFAGRIRSLVLNDMAPELAWAAIERIKAYAGQPPVFDTVPALEVFFRQAYAPFGTMTDTQWRHLTETSVRRLPDGRVTPHYDPAIIRQFYRAQDDFDLWAAYDALSLPVMVLRGEHSDLVLHDTVHAMHTRGPGRLGRLTTHEVPGCGHAPALNVWSQIQKVDEFLRKSEA